MRFAKDFNVGNGTLKPEVTLMTYHDFAADQADTTSAFVLGGNAFVSNAAKPTRNSYEAGVGAGVQRRCHDLRCLVQLPAQSRLQRRHLLAESSLRLLGHTRKSFRKSQWPASCGPLSM
ncbi:autotransporter outer membrane beta-barrel domain-containing protein (plasmid) [Pseudomonas aeruginosa]|uniref:autotransporter outer membrane beta-barrel domain-containing protein n=1 Tax=Pseudomonas aeruginosa TaxID=287 RepID=UPI003BAC8EC4